MAFFADAEIVEGHVRLRGPETKVRWDVSHASPVCGVDAVIFSWAADECDKALGQELSAEEEKSHGNFARTAK